MHLLQRIRFPHSPSRSALFFHHDSTASMVSNAGQLSYDFQPGQTLSSNSYQNSFFEFVHRRHRQGPQCFLSLSLSGDFEISLWKACFGKKSEAFFTNEYLDLSANTPVKIPLPILPESAENSRYYFTLKALSQGLFFGGTVESENSPAHVRLAVVLCTFRREEYIKKTVRRILNDEALQERVGHIVIVDNGRTLSPEEFDNPRITLIPNRNCGGSGGFSCGMVEVLDRDLGTHILLMDDDIECDTEALLRTITFYEHNSAPTAISGSMFDLNKPHMHFEAGALYGQAADTPHKNPLKIQSLKCGLNMEGTGAIDALLLNEHADYGAFWFFAFPVDYAGKLGLLHPFFVIGDDIEFGLRLSKKAGVDILPMPGVGVWHAPFYSKISSVKRYFFVRNLLAIDAMYNDTTYWDIIKHLAADFESDLCKFNYGMTLMLIRAFEDFLRGPEFLVEVDPEALMDDLNRETASLDDNQSEWSPKQTASFEQPPIESTWRTLVRRATLGGHLLTPKLLTNPPMQVLLGGVGQWKKNYLCRSACFLHKEGSFAYTRTINGARGRALALRFLKAIRDGRSSWPAVKKAWSNHGNRFNSAEFWKKYCE